MADSPHNTTLAWVALADELERLQRRVTIDPLFADINWFDLRFRYKHTFFHGVSFVRHRFEGIPAANPLKGGLGALHTELHWERCTAQLNGERPRRILVCQEDSEQQFRQLVQDIRDARRVGSQIANSPVIVASGAASVVFQPASVSQSSVVNPPPAPVSEPATSQSEQAEDMADPAATVPEQTAPDTGIDPRLIDFVRDYGPSPGKGRDARNTWESQRLAAAKEDPSLADVRITQPLLREATKLA